LHERSGVISWLGSMDTVQGVAVLAETVLLVMRLFHLALAAGLPWGVAAWGGTHRILPSKLRAGSVAAAAVLACAGLVILARAGLVVPGALSMFVRAASWAFAGYFALNTLGNLSSSSRVERVVMTPVAAMLAVCFAIVARA
jgi:hypothetical protein